MPAAKVRSATLAGNVPWREPSVPLWGYEGSPPPNDDRRLRAG